MPDRLRSWLGLVAVLVAATAVGAQPVRLADGIKPGDYIRYEIDLSVTGTMTVDRGGKPETMSLKASASHVFVERSESTQAVRHYSTAVASGEVGGDRSRRELPADRRVIVARRTPSGVLHFSPAGPLSRDELDLVAEHFDTLALAGLLPGREVSPGDTWPIAPEAAQRAGLFDALTRADLTGKLVEVANGTAVFTVVGTAEGVENGAGVKLTVNARGAFDLAAGRVSSLVWEQADARSQGPASPATDVTAVVRLTRTAVSAPVDLPAATKVSDPVPDRLTRLRYSDPTGRYRLVYPRDWHVVGVTADHLVLRLLDGGDFTAQATVTAWKKVAPGKHTAPDEFKAVLGRLPGWEPERVLADGPLSVDSGSWAYGVAAAGKQDGQAVVQSFLLLAGPDGDQAAITVLAPADRADRVAGRDREFAKGISFGK